MPRYNTLRILDAKQNYFLFHHVLPITIVNKAKHLYLEHLCRNRKFLLITDLSKFNKTLPCWKSKVQYK